MKITVARQLVLMMLLALAGCEQEINQYQTSWEHRAHQLQRELDAEVPLTRATFFGTHNSYNASSYTTAQSYLDPNQTHSITNQLRMDIRALELDVHTFNTYDVETRAWGIDLLLCHGLGNHIGCRPWDRPFRDGLQEIADWLALPENSEEVLLVYIEDHIHDLHYPWAIGAIESTIGQYVYKPAPLLGCNDIPADLSKQDIRDAGKNIVLISDGCQNFLFNTYVYGGFEGGPGGYPTAGVEDLQNAPQCLEPNYSDTDLNSLFFRVQEDRTILSNLVGSAGPRVTPEVVGNMVQCEINLIGMDKLRPFDGRLQAGIWSWDMDQPEAGAGLDCALHNVNGRFESGDCAQAHAFACREQATGDWLITGTEASWEQGFDLCAQAAGDFTVPFSAKDNANLMALKQQMGIENIWLGYGRNSSGDWQVYR